MGGLCNGTEIPVPCSGPVSLSEPGQGDIPHGGRPLIFPGGGGHGQVVLQGADAVVPAAPVHVLPAQIVGVPVILRLLLHGQLQQRQVLSPGLCGVGVVVQLHPLYRHGRAGDPLAHPFKDLVDRVYPLIAVPGMGLFIPEDHPLAAVRVETPSIAVGRLSGPRLPSPLQRSPPSGVKHLIQIGAHTDVCVLRY